MGKLNLKEIAKIYGKTPKTFARRVRAEKIPHELFGKNMIFDLATVQAHFAARASESLESNVVQFKPNRIKSRTKSKFAAEVGL